MSNFKSSDKVWIYTSPTKFTEDQKDLILAQGKKFLQEWESHGDKVKGEILIAYDHFIVVIADDCGGNMCGRAQDAQVRLAKELSNELGIDLLDRMQIAFRTDENEVNVKKMPSFMDEIKAGKVTKETIVFNNLVASVGDFEASWEVPLKESWHARLI